MEHNNGIFSEGNSFVLRIFWKSHQLVFSRIVTKEWDMQCLFGKSCKLSFQLEISVFPDHKEFLLINLVVSIYWHRRGTLFCSISQHTLFLFQLIITEIVLIEFMFSIDGGHTSKSCWIQSICFKVASCCVWLVKWLLMFINLVAIDCQVNRAKVFGGVSLVWFWVD